MNRLEEALKSASESVNDFLAAHIPRSDSSDNRLFEAMRYSTLIGGKRVRPFLVINCASLFNVPIEWVMPNAAAIEMVHTYSLIHDDLPSMDDDDLRRGQPTCHKAFDEATAILAGDALLTYAFQLVADKNGHPDSNVRVNIVHELALSAGGLGMVGGQMMDLMAESKNSNIKNITLLQQRKTGALFRFSCEVGAILGQGSNADRLALSRYADCIGLAFQISDDLLDVEGTEAILGKAVNKDAAAGKVTFVDLLGIEGARKEASDLIEEASCALQPFGKRADLLRDVARYIVTRKN